MTSDTITIDRIKEVAIKLNLATIRVLEIGKQADKGEIHPAEAAKEIREIMEELNRAAS